MCCPSTRRHTGYQPTGRKIDYGSDGLPPGAVVGRVDGAPAARRLGDPFHDVAVAPAHLLRVDAVLPLVEVAEQLGARASGAVPPDVIPVPVTG